MKNPFNFLMSHVTELIGGIAAAEAIGGSSADKKTKAIAFGSLGLQLTTPHIANHPEVQNALGIVNDALVALAKAHQLAQSSAPSHPPTE